MKAILYRIFLYTEEAQDITGKHLYRPTSAKAQAKYAKQLPKLNLFKIEDVRSWEKAAKVHFSDGGSFDQIYSRRTPRCRHTQQQERFREPHRVHFDRWQPVRGASRSAALLDAVSQRLGLRHALIERFSTSVTSRHRPCCWRTRFTSRFARR